MVINKNGLITENQNTQDNTLSNELEQTALTEEIKNFDLNSNNDNEISKAIEYNQKLDECLKNIVIQNNIENTTNMNSSNSVSLEDHSNSSISSLSSEKNEIKEKTVETNCLALTVRKDYNLSIFKNSIITTFRVSWKIAVSTFLLNLLKLFF